MKKYIVFAISFIVLFSLFQVLSGMILTFVYTPNFEEAWNLGGGLSQEAVIKSNSDNAPFLTLFMAFLSATIAYFIPKKFMNDSNGTK